MNTEPEAPLPYDPDPQPKPVPRMMWVLAALAPTALIMLMAAHSGNTFENGTGFSVVVFVLNPAVTLYSCYHLLDKMESGKIVQVLGAIFLGMFFAVLNALVGV